MPFELVRIDHEGAQFQRLRNSIIDHWLQIHITLVCFKFSSKMEENFCALLWYHLQIERERAKLTTNQKSA